MTSTDSQTSNTLKHYCVAFRCVTRLYSPNGTCVVLPAVETNDGMMQFCIMSEFYEIDSTHARVRAVAPRCAVSPRGSMTRVTSPSEASSGPRLRCSTSSTGCAPRSPWRLSPDVCSWSSRQAGPSSAPGK
jgi:hypothetical protein